MTTPSGLSYLYNYLLTEVSPFLRRELDHSFGTNHSFNRLRFLPAEAPTGRDLSSLAST